MTRQDYYNLLVETSRTGGFPSIDRKKASPWSPSGQCLYRGPDGKKCAAGLLIPDELYNPKMEGAVASTTLTPDLLPEHMTMYDIDRIQAIHDNSSVSDEWNHKAFVQKLNNNSSFSSLTDLVDTETL